MVHYCLCGSFVADCCAELKINFPEFYIEDYKLDDYFLLLSKDKKNTNENLTCILSKGKGKLFIHELLIDDKMKEMIREYFNSHFSRLKK